MRPNDGVGGDGGIGATGEEAGGRSTATMEEFDPSRSAKGKSIKGKAAKERAPKKSKGKSALASDSASAADHVGTDSTAEDRLGTDSTAEDRLGTGSVAADPMASEPVVADLELTDLDLTGNSSRRLGRCRGKRRSRIRWGRHPHAQAAVDTEAMGTFEHRSPLCRSSRRGAVGSPSPFPVGAWQPGCSRQLPHQRARRREDGCRPARQL